MFCWFIDVTISKSMKLFMKHKLNDYWTRAHNWGNSFLGTVMVFIKFSIEIQWSFCDKLMKYAVFIFMVNSKYQGILSIVLSPDSFSVTIWLERWLKWIYLEQFRGKIFLNIIFSDRNLLYKMKLFVGFNIKYDESRYRISLTSNVSNLIWSNQWYNHHFI